KLSLLWLMDEFTIEGLAKAKPEQLHGALKPLGLWRRRAILLIAMAEAWLEKRPQDWQEVDELPGCGKYACDSWRIFIQGHTSVRRQDGKLKWYLKSRR